MRTVPALTALACGLVFYCLPLPPPAARAQGGARPVPALPPVETFEGVRYAPPKGWRKKADASSVVLSTEGAKGMCVVTLFKVAAAPAGDPRAGFDATWDALVPAAVKVTEKPRVEPVARENGWTTVSGLAPCEIDGRKGVAVLATMTRGGDGPTIGLLVLTDTDAYQGEIAAFLESVKPSAPERVAPPAAPAPPGAATKFDDGWTAAERKDWVEVRKGEVAVLVHHPDPKADAYHSVLKEGLQNAWNLLVAPRYGSVRNFTLKPIQSFESISFAEADAEERATGRTVHVVLFKKHDSRGGGRYLEFVAPTRAAFEREFGPYRADEFGWEKLSDMQARNRFPVGAKDLAGTAWATTGFASLAYYYVNGGGSAGATATATADTFTFAAGGTYRSEHTGASGAVGDQRFSRQVYEGEYVADGWTLTLTKRFRGEPESYRCHFEAVRGGRILVLTDRRDTVLALVRK